MNALASAFEAARGPRVYFGDRGGPGMVGIGVSRLVRKDPCTVGEALRPPDEGPWVFAVRFDPEQPPGPAWAPFGAALWWRPARWLRDDGARRFAPRGAHIEIPANIEPYASGQWDRAFDAAGSAIQAGELGKVVLARPVDRPRPAQPVAAGLHTEDPAFAFALCLDDDYGFAGVSPELLLRQGPEGTETEALAGTRARGAPDVPPTEKERREHAFVVDAIARDCAPHRVQVGAPAWHAHGDVRLLRSPIHIAGRPDPWELAARLMPTPAVCGTPRAAARAFLRTHEGFDRGLYAGVVGVVDDDGVVMTVALRSMLWRRDQVRLFVGGGLVAGSDREAERAELSIKAAHWTRWCAGGGA